MLLIDGKAGMLERSIFETPGMSVPLLLKEGKLTTR
jgi:hypothetical protein